MVKRGERGASKTTDPATGRTRATASAGTTRWAARPGAPSAPADRAKRRIVLAFALLTAALVALVLANLCIGTVPVPAGQIPRILSADPVRLGAAEKTLYQVIWSIRLPRLCAAIILGGALALSGFLLQTFFNNPIASPFVLGVSSGAKLAVALAMIVVVGSLGVMTSWMLVLAAFLGSLVVMGFVLLVARRVRSGAVLIVAGVMVGYICSAATDFLVTFASDQNIVNLRNWSMGSFSGIAWKDVRVMTLVVAVAAICSFLLAKPMGAFQLGEAYAQSMGVDVRRFRTQLVVLSSLLSATVTAFAGPISFVGIAVPHLVKRLLGTSKPLLVVPASFLGGSCFCLLCDLIARSAFAPTELSLSTVTALFGAPVVIWVLLERRGRRG